MTDLVSAVADGARRSRFLLLSFFFVISRLLLTPAPEVQPLPTQFCCFRGWPQLRGSNHVLYFLNLSGFTMNNPKRNKTLNQDLFQNKGTKTNQDQDDIENGTIVKHLVFGLLLILFLYHTRLCEYLIYNAKQITLQTLINTNVLSICKYWDIPFACSTAFLRYRQIQVLSLKVAAAQLGDGCCVFVYACGTSNAPL